MAIFVIVLDRPDDDAWAAIETKWRKNRYIHSATVALIAADGKTLTGDIAEKIGLNDEGAVAGFVVQMDYFAGRTSAAMVEWVSKNRE